MRRVLFVFGTRPEAIKLCPVIAALQEHESDFETHVCVTAQHRDLLDQVLDVFGVIPDYDLDVMEPGQSLFDSTARIMTGLADVLQDRLTWLWFKVIRQPLCAALWQGSTRGFQWPTWKPVFVRDTSKIHFPKR